MRRVLLWVVALVLGSLAASALADFTSALTGWPALGLSLLSLVGFAFVTVSIVTAMEVLFPTLRVQRVASGRRGH